LTREDLAVAFLRFERAYGDHPPAPDRLAELNRGFDRATLEFFSGNTRNLVRSLDALRLSFDPSGKPPLARGIAESLVVHVEPRVVVSGPSPAFVAVRVASLGPVEVPEGEEVALTLRIRGPREGEGDIDVRTIRVPAGTEAPIDVSYRVPIEAGERSPGPCTLEIGTRGPAPGIEAARFFVVPESPAAVRDGFRARLDALPAGSDDLEQARASCRARIELLGTVEEGFRSIDLLTDPYRLAGELEGELQALEKGRNPYRRRPGDLWRVVRVGEADLPFRLFAPPGAAGDEPIPLIVALHGAGGDENLFHVAYGAGRLRRLAEARGFLLACPLTYTVMASPPAFDRLVETLAREYAVDPGRIYVLGHSLGAGAAVILATRRGDRLAAYCCLAGGAGFPSGPSAPPGLVVAGDLDTIVPASGIARQVDAARKAGAPVEFRLLADYGHTLLVGDVLPDVVAWLLAHARPEAGR